MELFKPTTDFAGRSVHSQSQDWCTPPQYVAAVKKVFGGEIELDPCSNSESVVKANCEFKLPETDGLAQEWNYLTIYVNPPYGSDRVRGTTIRNWLAKCAFSRVAYGSQIIALVPVATNTSHWKKYIFGSADAVCFLYDTRLRFLVNGNVDNKGAPMACAMIYWGDNLTTFENVFNEFGAVVNLQSLKRTRQKGGQDEMPLFNLAISTPRAAADRGPLMNRISVNHLQKDNTHENSHQLA